MKLRVKRTFTLDRLTIQKLESFPYGLRSQVIAMVIDRIAAAHVKHGDRAIGPLMNGKFDLVLHEGEGR